MARTKQSGSDPAAKLAAAMTAAATKLAAAMAATNATTDKVDAEDEDRGAVASAAAEDDADSDETLYNLYKPKRLNEGKPHPDPVRGLLKFSCRILTILSTLT
eukprot:1189148-Prorocentrum_minimum.AAC.3